jgi:hypothetical protein
MIGTLVVILSFCAGFWLSSQFREKEFELNNDFVRKLFIRRERGKPQESEKKPESLIPNDSPYSQTFNEGE